LEAYSTTPRQNSTPPRSTSLVSGHLLISDTPFQLWLWRPVPVS
jgi:hypothetical protein